MPQAHDTHAFPPKLGEVELELSCSFDPSVRLKLQKTDTKTDSASIGPNFESNKLERKRQELREQKAQTQKSTPGQSSPEGKPTQALKAGDYKRNLDPIESAIEKAMALKSKMLAAETNQDLDLRGSIKKQLYDGASLDLLLDRQPVGFAPVYKETELERLKLALQQPEIESVIGARERKGRIKEKYSLDMSEIEKLRITVYGFVPEHPVLGDRLREKNLFLQLKLPKFHEKVIQDTLEFALEEHCESPQHLPHFSVNKEIKNSYSIKEIGLERLSSSKVAFTLLLKTPKETPSNSKPVSKNVKLAAGQQEDQSSSGFTVKPVARGFFNLGNLLNAENFKFEGKVNVDSLIGLDKKKNEFLDVQPNKNKLPAKKDVKKKPEEDILPKEVGYFSVSMEFINENIRIVPLPEPPKPSEEEIKLEEEKRRLTALKQSKVEMERRLKDEPLLPVCLFVHILRASKIPRREDSKVSRNLYIQHKVYGTPDDISSATFWNQSNPEIDHRMVIPLTRMAIELMKDVPFTVAVWDKRDLPKQDELLGMVHVSLKAVYSLLWPMTEEDVRAMLAKQDLNLLELTNKYYAIERLASCHETGFLKVYAALGNIHQVSEYNSLHPANNSRMLGVDPTNFDFQTQEILHRKRDPRKKKKLKLNEIQKSMLDRDPSARHLTTTLVDQLNNDEIGMDQFLRELHGLMSRHPDVRIVDAIKTIEKEAEICNPFESTDTSRKNYLRLGDHQLVYDHFEKKYFQIWGDGLRTALDKCHFRRDDGSLEVLFVDPKVIKVKRDEGGMRMLATKQVGKLKKMGKYFNMLSEEEAERIRLVKAARKAQLQAEAKAEEDTMDLQIREAEKKLEETKAILKAARAAEDMLRHSQKETSNINLPNSEGQEATVNKEDSSPLGAVSPKTGISGWERAKAKLDLIKKNTPREEESYASPTARSIAISGKSGKEKLYVNLLRTGQEHSDSPKAEKENSVGFSRFQRPPDSPRSPRSMFKENKHRGSQLSGSDKYSSTHKFDVIQVGMALHGAIVPAAESSEDTSEENKQQRNIDLVDRSEDQENYDPTVKIRQYDTEVQDDIEIPDPILNLTVILEYMRREIVRDQSLRKNLRNLLLGQFQPQMAQGIAFEDMEYLMEQYRVSVSASELKSVFDFLDSEGAGEISLHDIHESLTAYMTIFKKYLRLYEGTFKYLLDKITNQENGIEFFEQFLSKHSENNHIECKQLFKFIRNEFLIQDTDLVEYQIREFGEFLYFDHVYIFNILNMLYYLDASYSKKCDPQLVQGLFHYESFLPLILQNVRKLVAKEYVDESPIESIKKQLLEFNLREESKLRTNNRLLRRESSMDTDERSDCIPNPVRINFKGFSNVMDSLGLRNLSLYEKMIVFYFICDLKCKNRHTLEPHHQSSIQEIYLFFQLIIGDNPEDIQRLINRKLVGSLASFVNKELMFQDSSLSPVQSRSSSFISMKKSRLLKRRKLNTDLVATDRTLYRLTLNVQGIEDLRLPASNDYCDFTISFSFPGEPEKFESQLFTYIPREAEYDLLLNTEHIFRCPTEVDISSVFAEQASVRFSLSKLVQNRVEETAYCLIPVVDILSQVPKSRKYFLYSASTSAGPAREHVGAVRVALSFFKDQEKLTQKDYFFSKHFVVNSQKIEKDVIFEREVPRKGYLTIQVASLSKVEGFYSLIDEMKALCRFSVSQMKYTLSFILKITEIQKPIVVKKEDRLQEILEEESEGEEEMAVYFDEKNPSTHLKTERSNKADLKLFSDYAVELKTATVGSLDSLFNFVDSFCSKDNHLIYNLQKFSVELTSDTLALFQSSDIDVGLYLGCSGPEGYKESKICSSLLPCNQFITLQNMQGKRQVCPLTSEGCSTVKADLDITLNYTKVFLNDGHVRMLNKFRELEATVELLRPLVLMVDLSQLISMDECCQGQGEVYFLKVYLGDTLVQSSSAIEWNDSTRLVKWAQMDTQESNSLIEFKMDTLIEELRLERVYEDYRKSPEDTSIREFMLNYVPQLKIYLIKHELNHSQKTLAQLRLDIKALVKTALESNLLPSCIVFKGYLPFEENSTDSTAESDPMSKLEEPDRWARKNHLSLMASSLIGSVDSLRDSIGSLDGDLASPKNQSKSPSFTRTRLGLRVIFLSSKGAFNKEALTGFKQLQQQAWVKSAEKFMQVLKRHEFSLETTMDVQDRGFVVSKEALKDVVAKELDFGKVMSNCVLDLVGQERIASNNVKLYNLICYPLHNNMTIIQVSQKQKEIEELEKEFRHFDTSRSGYVQFGEAIKLILNQKTSHKLSMKQLQAFKYSDLLRDFMEGLPKLTIRALERTGFDYVVFLNELLESARRIEQSQRQSTSKSIPANLQLLMLNARQEPYQKQEQLVEAEEHLNRTLPQKLVALKPDQSQMSYIFTITITRGEHLDAICSDPFPSTLVQLTRNFSYWQDPDTSATPTLRSEVVLRDPDPEWLLSTSSEVSNLDLFLKSNQASFIEIDLIERCLTRDRTPQNMFRKSTVAKKRLSPASLLRSDEVAKFAADGRRRSMTVNAKLDIDQSDACIEVEVRLAKKLAELESTVPRPSGSSLEGDIEAVKKTFREMEAMAEQLFENGEGNGNDKSVKALKEMLIQLEEQDKRAYNPDNRHELVKETADDLDFLMTQLTGQRDRPNILLNNHSFEFSPKNLDIRVDTLSRDAQDREASAPLRTGCSFNLLQQTFR